ncbi:putative bifunctional diguanylate cyclase/phosphodiesterase [Sphingomonas profundi]|uniref:putative bifunctional diguanylate cyclase/phosphodiesterase n=1 Tax=Alterirhizorhabdus profundi TaxID=2681549 RepID=UPI001E3CD720|nr:bifunctional diguanylate cyclase/phosphodiesterase [Sphingomonas profundi]
MVRADPPPAAGSPIFMLSFHHRDALAAVAGEAGWPVIAARRAGAAARRFVGSGASIAVVDARDAFDDGLAAARALGPVVEANAAALLVLLDRHDLTRLERLHAAGATHFLMSPFGEIEFVQALRFAARHAERLAGGRRSLRDRAALIDGEAEGWRWLPGEPHLRVAPPLARRLGLSGERLPLAEAARLLGAVGLHVARRSIARLLADRRPTAFAHEMPGGRIAHHLNLAEDGAVVARIEALEERPDRDGRSRDSLTGLTDDAGLRRWIEASPPEADRPGCILILLALGRFEVVNSAYGTVAGDALLRGVARRIERQAADGYGRPTCVARIGGTEFAVAMDGGATMAEATALADRLAVAITQPFAAGERIARLSCRIGIAAAEPGDDGEAMLRRAGAALAQARSAEPGAIRVLDASGEAAAAHHGRLEADLREALAREEIELLFQPQVSIATRAIVGVEALARWRHPDLGEIGAETLFSVAERSDYLVPLSEHVQARALARAAAWPSTLGRLRLAVNVTASDVAQPGFADRFLAMVDASGFPRARLTVELTESGLIDDLGQAAGLLAQLRAGGLRVAADDFGTGYSSLAYLKALPLDYLKIDKRLAEDIAGSPRDRVVVRGVIEMARSLGLAVVAEGVETEAQLALLAADGCNYYQGFLCSPPIDEASLSALVDQAAARPARGPAE